MPSKSKRILNTIKTYRMSPNLACKLNQLSVRNNISEAQLVRDILNLHVEQSGFIGVSNVQSFYRRRNQ
jgi:predicted DNA-binding protein